MVKILSDVPSQTDAFSMGEGDDGPLGRIAGALERRILSPEGGGAIGLQGEVGSGKSTTVRLLKGRLESNDCTCLLVFDAWSHDGDPLRRSFTEALIDSLLQRGWIPKAKWQREKLELAKRVKRTEERKTSSPSGFAISLALSALFVPVGMLVTRDALKAATLSIDTSLPVSWLTVFGMVLTVLPLLIALGNLGRLLLRKKAERGGRTLLGDVIALENWSFLSQHGTTETASDTVETLDPTTIEFEERLNRLLDEALSTPERRIVLVIDNLDRLSAEKSLKVWSNLQTFVHYAANDGKHSAQFSLIVAYSATALDHLWSKDVANGAESLFEKTFRVRYHTPPPTDTDWKRFLREILREAVPELPEAGLLDVLEVADLIRRERNHRLVPRQLKLFVNQFAALWDLWQGELPSAHLAYAVLRSANRDSLERCLVHRTADGEPIEQRDDYAPFPSKQAIQICGEDLARSLTAVYFNVAPAHAMQLLIEVPIEQALTSGDSGAIEGLESSHREAFWDILQSLVRRLAPSQETEGLAKWSQSLQLLKGGDLPEQATRIRAYIRKRLDSLEGNWHPLNEETVAGLCEWLQLDATTEMKQSILKVSERTLRSKQDTDVDAKLAFVEHLHEMGLKPREPEDLWKVNMEPADWLGVAAARSTDESDTVFFEPMCTTKSVVAELVQRSTIDDESEFALKSSDVSALSGLRRVRSRVDASDLVTAVAGALDSTLSSNETSEACKCIRRIHELRLLGERSAEDQLNSEDRINAMVELLETADVEKDDASTILASLIWSNASLPWDEYVDNPARPNVKKRNLKSFFENGDMELSEEVWSDLRRFEYAGVVGQLAGKDRSGLMSDLVELAIARQQLAWALPDWFVSVNAGWLKSTLEARQISITDAMEQLEASGEAITHSLENMSATDGKGRKAIRLYLDYGSDDVRRKVGDLARQQLRDVDSGTWNDDLRSDLDLARFARELQHENEIPVVSSAFKKAVTDVLPDLLKSELELDTESSEVITDLVASMPGEIRRELGAQSLLVVQDSGRGINENAVELIGDSIIESHGSPTADDAALLIARTIQQNVAATASWCADWLTTTEFSSKDLSEEKAELLSEELDAAFGEAESDEAWRDSLRLIGKALGLKVRDHSESAEGTEAADAQDS